MTASAVLRPRWGARVILWQTFFHWPGWHWEMRVSDA